MLPLSLLFAIFEALAEIIKLVMRSESAFRLVVELSLNLVTGLTSAFDSSSNLQLVMVVSFMQPTTAAVELVKSTHTALSIDLESLDSRPAIAGKFTKADCLAISELTAV